MRTKSGGNKGPKIKQTTYIYIILGPMLTSQPCSHTFWVLMSLHLLSLLLKMFTMVEWQAIEDKQLTKIILQDKVPLQKFGHI